MAVCSRATTSLPTASHGSHSHRLTAVLTEKAPIGYGEHLLAKNHALPVGPGTELISEQRDVLNTVVDQGLTALGGPWKDGRARRPLGRRLIHDKTQAIGRKTHDIRHLLRGEGDR